MHHLVSLCHMDDLNVIDGEIEGEGSDDNA